MLVTTILSILSGRVGDEHFMQDPLIHCHSHHNNCIKALIWSPHHWICPYLCIMDSLQSSYRHCVIASLRHCVKLVMLCICLLLFPCDRKMARRQSRCYKLSSNQIFNTIIKRKNSKDYSNGKQKWTYYWATLRYFELFWATELLWTTELLSYYELLSYSELLYWGTLSKTIPKYKNTYQTIPE